jgi:2-polyprenyl-6-methoxyphenol hydroxylase-like FAD-dependent oxidoreductase
MAKAMATGGQVHGVFPTYCVSVPNPCARGVVLIGDAAGTCHPVTASGMTAGLLDASSLLEAFRTSGGNFATLSGHFLRCRGARQKSRLTLASTLYEVLAGEGPEHHLLRASMLRYWRSADGAAASVALLGMSEDRVSELLLAELRIFAGTPRHLRDIPARAPRLPAWRGALGIAFRHSWFLLGGRPPFVA